MLPPVFYASYQEVCSFCRESASRLANSPAWRGTNILASTIVGCALLVSVLPASATPVATKASTSGAEMPMYCLDPVHTRVMFAIEHAGFSKAIGTVSGSTGELRFDPSDWSQASVRVVVPLIRLDLGDEKWNKAALASNLLNGARYPDAVFVSDRIEPLGEGRATLHGTLTLRGVSQPIALDTALNALKRHPLPPFRRTVGFSARGMLSRKAFGIDAWPSVIGDEVELRIEIEATHGRCDHTSEAAEPSSPADDATDPPHADSSREGLNNAILAWYRHRGLRLSLSPLPPDQALTRLIRERAIRGARKL
jgi:polyisoprenoid-binding protein YceI